MGSPLLFLTGDARILDLIRKGDERALTELYSLTRKMVTSYIIRNSGTHDDADDMLQESLIVLWERVRTGRFEYTAKLSTFIFSTARNIWMRRLAHQRREVTGALEPSGVPGDDEPTLERMAAEEESQGVQAAMEVIGEPCRTLLLLFYWEELSLDDIARRMGFANANTVKSKKYQCKKALRALLERAGHTRD